MPTALLDVSTLQIMNENLKLQLLARINDLNRTPSVHIAAVQEIVTTLKTHIEGERSLTHADISSRVSELTKYTLGVPVPIPLNSNTAFTRGVKYTEEDGGSLYKSASRLSYIPASLAHRSRQGRLNKAGESMFYASLATSENSVSTVLAEIDATAGDIVNLLYSVTNGEPHEALHVIPIGIMDYFRRGMAEPFSLHPMFRELYQLHRDTLHPSNLEAVHLCDEFLNGVLTARAEDTTNSDGCALYDVTCALASDFLSFPQLDGILYQSTKSHNFPNVALRPASVDEKLRYTATAAYRVVERTGDTQFVLRSLGNGIVDDDQINWVA
ncbi:hypothetical protein RY831_29625 [Noviherbaspirillum sp. CPCC 100848]|uniref:RES domain-containing protein n=1 Tax=Noviherbaspirillum album TaxID=3080276 RepID=A0ABU6JIT5_9BURK|nr:hypothetical protein [Noviherbaspirillum sp. CPCC 100848]MEC4723318.1 hypothetical protein [Noviherbaspirillum sp. CPCC 100848]